MVPRIHQPARARRQMKLDACPTPYRRPVKKTAGNLQSACQIRSPGSQRICDGTRMPQARPRQPGSCPCLTDLPFKSQKIRDPALLVGQHSEDQLWPNSLPAGNLGQAWDMGLGEEMNHHRAAETDQVFMVASVSDLHCGGGNHIFNLATGIFQRGWDVHVVCFEAGSLSRGLREAGIAVHICPIRRKSDWRGWMDLRRLLQAERPSIVHSHGERGTFMASWAARTVGIPVIIATVHRSVPQTASWSWPLRQLYTFTEDWTLHLATTAIIAVSESLRSELTQKRDHSPEKIAAIPNATQMLEPSSIATFREQSTELRHSLGLAEDNYVIGTVGRVAKEKGFQHVIEAMTTVLGHVPHARLVIVGDGPHRDALVAQARALHLETRVRFAGHQTDVNPWLASFDLFVLPTPWEAFGIALLEAMRFSIPVIATDCAGPAEIIQDQQSGILVPPRDSVALARAIIELSEDPGRSRRMGRRGFQTVKRCYSVERMVEATLAFYDEQRAMCQVPSGPWSS